MPYFICPRCAWRGTRLSRTSGFSDRPQGCSNCGFGFLFELMDDYYASPLSGIFVCDQQARLIAFGKGAAELSGYTEQELMGQDLGERLDLKESEAGEEPHKFALEWGVRVLDKTMTMRNADHEVREVTGDFFPAYDDDGGLLAVLTPRST